jgi:hypothetical protein
MSTTKTPVSKVPLQLGTKNARTCKDCTKCCEGWLYAEILGQELVPGSPCRFVETNVGCTIYEEEQRPKNPCDTYQCFWKLSNDVPEKFSPRTQNVILSKQSIEGIEYLAATYAGSHLSSEMFSWFISYGVQNQLNLQWTVEGRPHHVGSIDFITAMTRIYPEAENIELPRRLP